MRSSRRTMTAMRRTRARVPSDDADRRAWSGVRTPHICIRARFRAQLGRVPVTSITPPQIGKRAWVFGSSGKDGPNVSQYSIARDGRLLVAIEDSVIRQSRTVLVQNWPELVAGR
jgi:hypothetical protein